MEKASLRLFLPSDDHINIEPFDEVNLRSFGSEWRESQFILNDTQDPYVNQFKNTDISLKYGHEAEMLQEVIISENINVRNRINLSRNF